MKHKLWISTSIVALLLGGVASPITYADSQNESSPSTIQENTTTSEQQATTKVRSSTIENPSSSNQEETKSDEKDANSVESTPKGSTTTSQVEKIAPVEEAIEENTTSQGTWGNCIL